MSSPSGVPQQPVWLEAHKRWVFDDATSVQSIRRLICLCSECHLTTRVGYASVTGRGAQARAHCAAVTGMTTHDVGRQIDTAGQLWIARSRRNWDLDLTILATAGFTVAQPQAPAARAQEANRGLIQASPPAFAHTL